MLARMVWRDVRSRPLETAALVVLVAVSVLLATVSAGLLQAVSGAADRLLDRAGAPDVVQMHTGSVDPDAISAWAADRQDTVAQQTVELLTLDGDRVSFAGEPQTGNVQQNSLVVLPTSRDLLLTPDGAPLTHVDPGTVWLPVHYAIEDGLVAGDTVTVTGPDGFARDLRVAGFHRDALMNTAIASSKRLAVSSADFAAIAAHTGTVEYLIEFWLHDPTGTGAFTADYLASGLPSAGPTMDRASFRLLTVIGEGLNAGVVILAAALLLVAGLLCLRLSLVTALRRERRELGVLRAIGVPARSVGAMQLSKYGAIGLVACAAGLAGGLALLPVMSRPLTAYAGEGDPAAWAAPVATAGAMFALVLAFVVVVLRRVGRISVVRALRADEGNPRLHGPRLSLRGPRLSLHGARRTPLGMRMGLIGAIRGWRTQGLLAVVFAVTTFVVVVPLSAAMTLGSASFIAYMGVPPSDLRVDIAADDPAAVAAVTTALAGDPAVEQFVAHTSVRAEVPDTAGLPVSVLLEDGDHTSLPLAYAEGRAPTAGDEVALSLVALSRTGRAVGDTVVVRTSATDRALRIVGAYQDITNGGSTGRTLLPADTADPVGHTFAIDLAAGADPDRTRDRLIAAEPGARVAVVDEYRAQTLGPVIDRIGTTAWVAATAATALAALVTLMTTRMVLAADGGQIAIQRALGTPDASVRGQYVTSVLTALAIGVPLGVLASGTAGEGLFNLLFEGLYGGLAMVGQGTSRIEFVTVPLITHLALPLALALVVAAATLVACRDVTDLGIRKVVAE